MSAPRCPTGSVRRLSPTSGRVRTLCLTPTDRYPVSADLERLTAAVLTALDVFDAPSAHYSTDPDVRAALDAMRDEERDAAGALRRALDGEG